MNYEQRLQSIHDLASARLRNGPLDPNVEHDLKQIVELATAGESQPVKAWLVERKGTLGPLWAHVTDDGHLICWEANANRATKFDSESNALDTVPLILDDGEDYPCPAVTVTEHEWVNL